ncbi:MAG: hypothetical protein Q9170_003765 [Blastenia crenularia]
MLSTPMSTKKKKTAEGKSPKALDKTKASFVTDHYQVYEPSPLDKADPTDSVVIRRLGTNLDYSIYDNYLLYMNPHLDEDTIKKIPQQGVRLDDLAVAIVLQSYLDHKALNLRWPAEFDLNGMPRATRAPLGNAFKFYVNAGDRDIDGYVAKEADVGFYYGWWRGLQVLMGKEGMDAGLYKSRPSWEEFKVAGFGWKREFKCVVQLPSGSAEDPTPGLKLRSPSRSTLQLLGVDTSTNAPSAEGDR